MIYNSSEGMGLGKNKVLYLDPKTLTYGVNKKAWWKCDKGHEWLAQISHRTQGSGCPYCSGRYAIKGENDLQTINPTLAKEWNYEKNNKLSPDNVMPNSGKKYGGSVKRVMNGKQ